MLLSVIIVSYNTWDLTQQALRSVLEQVKKSKLLDKKTEVIVIDNNSTDQSPLKLSRFASKEANLKLILNKQNLGFAKANNQGIKKAQGQFLFLLNSDTQLEPSTLEKLVTAFEKTPHNEATAHLSSYHNQLDNLGILAAQLKNPDGSHQPQGGSFPNLISLASHMFFLDDLPLFGQFLPSTQHTGLASKKWHHSPLIKQSWVAATAMMIKRQVIDEIGLLDERIFMYGEDTEFCVRATQHHWDIAIHPTAQVIHHVSASSSKAHALQGEILAYQYIWAKHKPFWQKPVLNLILRMGCFLRIFLFGTILGQKQKAQVYRQILTKL